MPHKDPLKRLEYARANRHKYKKIDSWYRLKYLYKCSKEDYLKLLEEQNGVCAICSTPNNRNSKKLGVDHCHTSGKIRGILCDSCNGGLGFFKDDPDLIKKALEYLEKIPKEWLEGL